MCKVARLTGGSEDGLQLRVGGPGFTSLSVRAPRKKVFLELRLERAQEEAVVSHRHVARLSAVVQGEAVEVEVAPRPRLFWADAVVSERSVVQLLRPPRTLEVLASEGAAVYGVKLDGEVWVTFRNGEDRGRFTETLTQRFPSLETDRVVVAPSDWLGCAACRGVVHVSLVAEHARVCHRL